MASLHHICVQLGYLGDRAGSRGHPEVFWEKLKLFSHIWAPLKDIDWLASYYLRSQAKQIFQQREYALNYPGDHEKMAGLITQAFRILRDPPADEDQDHKAAPEIGNANIPAGTVEVAKSVKPGPGSEVIASTLTALSVPHSALNKIGLVRILKGWIDSHPSQRFPELSRYDMWSFQDHFAALASLTDTKEDLWVFRLGIVEQYLGWVLAKPDGSHILVRAQYFRKHKGHVFYPWLGGERGFSDEIIAYPRGVRVSMKMYAKEMNLDPDDLLNEYNITKEDLEHQIGSQPQSQLLKNEITTVTTKSINDAETSGLSFASMSSFVPLVDHLKAQKSSKLTPPTESTKSTRRKRSFASKGPKNRATKVIKLGPAIDDEIYATTAAQEPRSSGIQSASCEVSTTSVAQHRNPPSTPTQAYSSLSCRSPATHNANLRTPPPSLPSASALTTPFTPFQPTTPTTPSIPAEVTFYFFLRDPTLGAIPTTYPLT
ncbi:MAG: hypothetical protein Q9170_007202, partial [Blastenia crenularia]